MPIDIPIMFVISDIHLFWLWVHTKLIAQLTVLTKHFSCSWVLQLLPSPLSRFQCMPRSYNYCEDQQSKSSISVYVEFTSAKKVVQWLPSSQLMWWESNIDWAIAQCDLQSHSSELLTKPWNSLKPYLMKMASSSSKVKQGTNMLVHGEEWKASNFKLTLGIAETLYPSGAHSISNPQFKEGFEGVEDHLVNNFVGVLDRLVGGYEEYYSLPQCHHFDQPFLLNCKT